jgi:hypothetical protein
MTSIAALNRIELISVENVGIIAVSTKGYIRQGSILDETLLPLEMK